MLGIFAQSPQRPRFQHRERTRSASETPSMVQLSASPDPDMSPSPSPCSGKIEDKHGSPLSPRTITSLQLALSTSTTAYPGYETYIEDGLICLKHKMRNLEKKKLKLEDYMKRLKHGFKLNEDQLDAVKKYEEVVHNLAFAKELHKTLGVLTQDLLKAQKKAVKREQMAKMESERKRLCTVLQMQYILQNLQHEHVRQDVLSSARRPLLVSAKELEGLRDLGALLNRKRDGPKSLNDQMTRSAVVYWELLEGKEKPVVGSTYKHMREWLAKLMDCGYFDQVVLPKDKKEPESHVKPGGLAALMKFRTPDVPTRVFLNRHYAPDEGLSKQNLDKNPPSHNWKEEFLALKEQEPPDSWDMELNEGPPSSKAGLPSKPSRAAAGFVLKDQKSIKKPNIEPKPKAQRKPKAGKEIKSASRTEARVEVFNSPSSLPKDPILRKQELDDLMVQISGSFSFMQDSLLDGEASQTHVHPRICASPVPSTPPAQRESKDSPAEDSSKTMHSTPLPSKLLAKEGNTSLTNGSQSLDNWDLDVTPVEVVQEKPQLPRREGFESPPLFRRKSSISPTLEEKLPAETPVPQPERQSPSNVVTPPATDSAQAFSTPPNHRSHSMVPSAAYHPVFKVNVPTPLCSGSYMKPDTTYSESTLVRYATASTQTPPELNPPEEEPLQPDDMAQSECVMVSGQMYTMGRSGQPYHARGSFRGVGRAGRGLPHYIRSPGVHRGGFDGYRTSPRSAGSFVPPSHSASTPIGARDTGYQSNYKHGGTGGQRSNTSGGWSDSSQVSSPDREGTYIVDLVDSGHGDSLSDMPVTPQGAHTLMPVHVYPISQQIRVAFSAARTFNFAPGTLDQPIAFDLLHSNVGEMFDMPSGRFTCPVPGTYVFIFHILKLAVNVPLYINLMRNDEVVVSGYANDGAPDHETASNHALLQLYQGDQLWLRLHRGAIYGSSWKYSTFSGFLLYQD
ncbi:caprin-2 isoform X2 [Clupea harengus]|uniref:Caprin-2 isoform X2 n=1 Tax=Clupea harengus TaxID=7950 RepID=A0A6P8GHK2_CLUHA|nr:caprin-2 isoform X2 [Clupea harengus]